MNRFEFDELPAELSRRAWIDWLKRYGIDPEDVAIPGWIERANNGIGFLSYNRDEQGRIQPNDDLTGAKLEVRVVWLREPPLPFPVETS